MYFLSGNGDLIFLPVGTPLRVLVITKSNDNVKNIKFFGLDNTYFEN